MSVYTSDDIEDALAKLIDDAGHEDKFFSTDTVLQTIVKDAPAKLTAWYEWVAKSKWFPKDLAKDYTLDLLKLALYDIHVFLDNSGSMNRALRREAVNHQLRETIELDGLFRSEGVRVHILNGNHPKRVIRNPSEFETMWKEVRFSGGTQLGTKLKSKIWRPIIQNQAEFKKPCLVYVFTDGEPTDEDPGKFRDSILECKRTLEENGYKSTAIAFGIIQVGDDRDAREFLDTLAQDPALKDHLSVATRAQELENEFRKNKGRRAATTSALILQCLIGAINTSITDDGDDD